MIFGTNLSTLNTGLTICGRARWQEAEATRKDFNIVLTRQEKKFCESGCAYNGITDFVTNMLMKVQHVAVSENSVHNSCVLLTVFWTWNFVLSLLKRDGICSIA